MTNRSLAPATLGIALAFAPFAPVVAFAEESTAEAIAPKPAASVPAAPSKIASKTLEITKIEGQILFPKVLFISSEDPARYPEFLHRTYLKTALDLGREALAPKTIQVDALVGPISEPSPSETSTPDAPEPATPSPIDPEVNP